MHHWRDDSFGNLYPHNSDLCNKVSLIFLLDGLVELVFLYIVALPHPTFCSKGKLTDFTICAFTVHAKEEKPPRSVA